MRFVPLALLLVLACQQQPVENEQAPRVSLPEPARGAPAPLELEHRVIAPAQPPPRGILPPTLVLLHGYGSNEADLIPLARELDPRLQIVSLRAPIPLGDQRFAWYPLDWSGETPRARDADMLQARATLVAALNALPGTLDTPDTVFLLGFSQGAILSLEMAIVAPEKIAGVIALSGRAPLALDEPAPSGLPWPPVFLAHGTADRVIPIEAARGLKSTLETQGVPLTYLEVPGGGHGVSPEVRRATARWLREKL